MPLFRCLILLAIVSSSVWAQDSTSTKVRDQLEETFEESDLEDDEAGEQLIQFLQELESNPVNINTADINELLQIPGITFITARSIIAYRENKTFEEINEVLQVSGIGNVTFQKISPYITVGSSSSRFRNLYSNPKYWLDNSKTEVISRFQQIVENQNGFSRPDSAGGYVGNASKYYQRIKIQSKHLSLNITQEKDAGESLKGPADFDFNSAHLALVDNGKLKKLIIGDYSVSFGQGLVLWSGGAFGKGREVIKTIGRNERGLRPYTSAQETNYFRGIAATVGDKNELSVFYSKIPRTASIVGENAVSFPSSSGFHRTLNEIDRRYNLDQQTLGGRFKLNTKVGLFGVSGYSTEFNSEVIRRSSISAQNDFSGTRNSVFGIDYRAIIGRSLIIGEMARSDNSEFAGIFGIETSVGENTELAILYRNYGSKYVSILGDGFGEASGIPQNERGFYVGLKHSLSKYTISTYFDQYFFDAPSGGLLAPSSGVDILGMVEATFSRALSGYILIRNESKEDVFDAISDNGREVEINSAETRSSYRIQIQHQPTRNYRTRTRVEWVRYLAPNSEAENGFLVYQDVRLNLSKKVLIDARFSLFDTDSFNARVYQFENDLRYVLTNVALNDKGQRWYFVVKYNATERIEFSAKLSQTIIEDAQVISSGLNQITGNTRTFFGAQIRMNIQ